MREKRTLGQIQTSVPADALQELEQIRFAMEVAEALSMKVSNMTLELVFLTERPTGERRMLMMMEYCQNHRKLVRVARQMIVGTALSERHMSARLG